MNLKQLSENLGLSQTTVSRALNGYPEVNEDTRRRVLQAAEQNHYSPNTRAKGLATGRAMAIGHVIPTSTSHEIVNPVFADFIAGAGEVYSRCGYDMTLSLVDDADEERAYRALKAKGTIDGIIIHGPVLDDPRIGLLKDIGLPFLVHGRTSVDTQSYSWIDVNNRRAFSRATTFLVELGHRRIALLNGLETMDFAVRRRDGYLNALGDAQIDANPTFMASDEMTETYGYDAARDMLAFEVPPTAFLVSSIIAALGVRRALDDAGLVLGRDVSVIIHDDELSYLQNGGDVPVFTATRSSVRDAGRLAADMLMAQITSGDPTPAHRLLEAQLVIGRSTGPAPKDTA